MSQTTMPQNAEIQHPHPTEPQALPQVRQPLGNDEPDLFGDHVTEEMLGALLGGETASATGAKTGQAEQAEQAEQARSEAQQKPEEAEPEQPEQPKQKEQAEQAGIYDIELFGQPVKVDSEFLLELCENGAQFIQLRPQVEQAMAFLQTMNNDSGFRELVKSYAGGPQRRTGAPGGFGAPGAPGAFGAGQRVTRPQPQPAFHAAGEPAADMGSMGTSGATASTAATGGEGAAPASGLPLEQLRAQLAEQLTGQLTDQLAGQLRQQLMAEIQQHYKPFVDNVNAFAAAQVREKAFARYQADPDHAEVETLMRENLQESVTTGGLSFAEAAWLETCLRENPQVYGEWFGNFKKLAHSRRQGHAGNQSGNPLGHQSGKLAGNLAASAGTITGTITGAVRTVARAPRLEGAASTAGDAGQEAYRQTLSRALGGDPAALGALL